MNKFQPNIKAPIALHRLCADVNYFPSSVQTADDVEAWKSDPVIVVVKERNGKLFAIKYGHPAT